MYQIGDDQVGGRSIYTYTDTYPPGFDVLCISCNVYLSICDVTVLQNVP